LEITVKCDNVGFIRGYEFKMKSGANTEYRAATIRLLGDPALRAVSQPVTDFEDESFAANTRILHATLDEFRRKHGFGRGVSAPQIGIPQRFIALNLEGAPRLVVNPEFVFKSDEQITMWDDCMSFPDLLVRLRRHASVSLRFQDERGDFQEWNDLDTAASELLQHEMDHLDGILAVDRAIDRDSIVMREVFERDYEFFKKQVDYVIY
jgi:peptide deformylase